MLALLVTLTSLAMFLSVLCAWLAILWKPGMNKPVTVTLKRMAIDGTNANRYRITKLNGAVVLHTIVGSFGADHRVGDCMDEKQVQAILDSKHTFDVTILEPSS